MTIRFDRSVLPPASLEFVVVADTHFMLDVGDAPLEFESRRVQGQRAGDAWAAIGALDPDLVVHLGDIVQEFPGRPDFERAMAQSLAQIDAAGVRQRCRFVVGNHDIGDRPDPTMPTGAVTEDLLRTWEARFGPSWQTWEAGGLRFVSVNSQLLNTDLPAATAQRAWFERTLAGAGDTPCVLFLHMPPYLHDPAEPWLGHYDNLGEPDRTWLLDLVRQHRVVAWFCGHVHFQFFDHVVGDQGVCRGFVTPSTSFTRPGFGHLFTSPPPPEHGRDDVPKMGFFLCRLVEGRLDVHRVRMESLSAAGDEGETVLLTPVAAPGAVLLTPVTAPRIGPAAELHSGGAPTTASATLPSAAAPRAATAAGTAADLPEAAGGAPAVGVDKSGPAALTGFGLGITLRHPLAAHTEVPTAWPSVIRQPVRNDYPLLACLEAGAAWVRVPATDLLDPQQGPRLRILRAEGVALQAVALGEAAALELVQALQASGTGGAGGGARDASGRGSCAASTPPPRADRLEVQLPGRLLPDVAALQELAGRGVPLVLCPVLPGQPVAGKQHKRTRIGYLPEELGQVDAALRDAGVTAAAACRLDAASPWAAATALSSWGSPGLDAAGAAEPDSPARDEGAADPDRASGHGGLSGLVLLGELPGIDDDANVAAVARWSGVAAALDAPLFLEPLVDLDRTMDVTHGLLDTLCNPRPAFEAARCAVPLARAAGAVGARPTVARRAGCEVTVLGSGCWLVVPSADGGALGQVLGEVGDRTRVCRLATGSVSPWDAARRLRAVDGPLLVVAAGS